MEGKLIHDKERMEEKKEGEEGNRIRKKEK